MMVWYYKWAVADNNSSEHWKLNSEKPWKMKVKLTWVRNHETLSVNSFKEQKPLKNSKFRFVWMNEKIAKFNLTEINYNMRVWSWLRMNAGGVLNTCKSNEALIYDPFGVTDIWLSGGRVSNAWVTCLIQGDNSWKRLLIPHKRTGPHGLVWKTPVVWDGPASD